MFKRLMALFVLSAIPANALAAADDISRLYNFSSGTTIQSSQVNGEFNQLVNTMNGKFGRSIANTLTGNNNFQGDDTHSGINIFSHATSPIKTDKILEYTGAAGVTIDSMTIKDGYINIDVEGSDDPGTPTDGDLWYDATSDTYKGRANGSTVNLSGGAVLSAVNVYTSSGTWTKPAGLSYIVVHVLGGGGGGGGADNTGGFVAQGGGGGAGGYSREKISAASLGATESYAVGAAGTAGADTGGTGGTGGTSSFGTVAFLQATGGAGGVGDASSSNAPRYGGAGGAGGTGSNGDVNATGQPGGFGVAISATMANSGEGGSSMFGGGAQAAIRTSTTDVAGTATSNYGAGGSGAADDDTTGSAGGAGGAGLVIVEEYTVP